MWRRLTKEEIANSLTHGFGLALSIAGMIALVVLTVLHGGAWRIACCSVYGGTLVLVYGVSTLYHSVWSPRWKRILRVVDHSAIYLLIAGTYTPFTLVLLRGHWGWTLFGVIWILAISGVGYKLFFRQRYHALSTVSYILMGWAAILAAGPIFTYVPTGGILFLISGGLFYTSGVAFYAWRRLPYHHAVWHAFVLFGSICHYVAVVLSVVPGRT
ncbi:MAG: PAQR family membrane homeostasis protein TrhA [Candidatus Acidiferrales bacterium]